MHRISMFNLKLDFSRSQGAFLYDVNTGKKFLDLFSLYSSLPLGYNHPIFQEAEFKEAILRACAVKIPNCEMRTQAAEDFFSTFSNHPSMKPFRYFHFCCTGALGIEAAIKTAIDYRGSKDPKVLRFKKSFHGINSYGGFVTDRSGSSLPRLEGFPSLFPDPLDNPVIQYRHGEQYVDQELVSRVLSSIREEFRKDAKRNISAVLVEPIQCTAGDWIMVPEFLKELRKLCTEFDVPLIFDEVQTGFGGTGTLWYFEQLHFIPDIVVFGKKTQVSGIMVQGPFGKIFERPVRLEVTWDGDVLDMIRCRYVMEAYRRYNILENVKRQGTQMVEKLRTMPYLRNVRQSGLLIAFDFEDANTRNAYVRGMREKETIVLSTQEKTVRWRPHLAFTDDDTAVALTRASNVLGAIKNG